MLKKKDVTMNEQRSLVPSNLDSYQPSQIIMQENPLAVLARELPSTTASILNRQVALQERAFRVRETEARLNLLQEVSRDTSAETITWLQTRPNHEQNFQSEFCGEVYKTAFFFCAGETVRAVKKVTTW